MSHFAGKEEILDRRIGANELSAIQACLAYVDAQREYYQRNPDHASLLHYAQKLASTPGKRDGLHWDTKPGEEESPLGTPFARARAKGYAAPGKGAPYHGYYFRLLTAQGPDAAGGAYDYLAHGELIGGFALVGYPAAVSKRQPPSDLTSGIGNGQSSAPTCRTVSPSSPFTREWASS